MNELVQADVQYLTQQKPEQMRLILSGMAAAMQDIEGKAEAMQSQNWFQRMVKTVTGKNKLTLEEIQRNRDKLNGYMAEAVAELYRLGQVDHSIIMSLGTQINEIYMEQAQLKQLLGAFAVKLNEKIESVDNFHMLITEIEQGVYTDGLPISNMCKVLSQFDKRILEEPRKLDIIRRALIKQGVIREKPWVLAYYLSDVLSVPMEEAGQVYMQLGTMRGNAIASLSMKLMENYHFLPDSERKIKRRRSVLEQVIRDADADESAILSTAEIYDDFVNSKAETQSGLLLPTASSDKVSKEELERDIDLCRRMAEWGNAVAQCVLGDCYYYGNGVEEDDEQAVYWYHKAAEQGNADAQCCLGGCYYNGYGVQQDYAQAVYWYRKAAEQGNADAQCCLGGCYHNGYGVQQDYAQAVYWFRKAAEQGHIEAQFFLGNRYRQGLGVEQDYAQAVYWYRKAAEQGHAHSQHNLGISYYDGEGVKQDYAQAVYWYRKAAEQGAARAQCALGDCYYFGNGVEENDEQAVYWHRKAAEQGHAHSQYFLGVCYYNGVGVKQDYAQAVYWYRKAAEQGHADAQYNLGMCYANGKGVKCDPEQALSWCREAKKSRKAAK